MPSDNPAPAQNNQQEVAGLVSCCMLCSPELGAWRGTRGLSHEPSACRDPRPTQPTPSSSPMGPSSFLTEAQHASVPSQMHEGSWVPTGSKRPISLTQESGLGPQVIWSRAGHQLGWHVLSCILMGLQSNNSSAVRRQGPQSLLFRVSGLIGDGCQPARHPFLWPSKVKRLEPAPPELETHGLAETLF